MACVILAGIASLFTYLPSFYLLVYLKEDTNRCPAALFLIQLPADAPGSAMEDGPSAPPRPGARTQSGSPTWVAASQLLEPFIPRCLQGGVVAGSGVGKQSWGSAVGHGSPKRHMGQMPAPPAFHYINLGVA